MKKVDKSHHYVIDCLLKGLLCRPREGEASNAKREGRTERFLEECRGLASLRQRRYLCHSGADVEDQFGHV